MTLSAQREQELWTAVLYIKNIAEAKKFFGDLLTKDEINDFAKRWLTARMLFNGESYKTIQNKTSLSTRTVARISNWLNEGTGGYRLLLNRTNNTHHTVPAYSRCRTAH